MWYLTGASNAGSIAAARDGHAIGLMMQPASRYERQMNHYATFAIDNGCFSQGGRFEEWRYLGWLTALQRHQERCLFAVAPDVYTGSPSDAWATWERSIPVMPQICELGYKPALVMQCGFDDIAWAIDWDAFDCLFIGGDTSYKLSPMATYWVRHAKALGKHVHMGRVNSAKRFRLARDMGCDSVDGTYLKFGPSTNLPRLLSWLAA